MSINPFFELYVGDRLSSGEFVNIFSPFLVNHAKPLFLPGNVVVKGVQGSGKSMLLSLLRPDVRKEYVRGGQEFPVSREISNFIGAGINLAHSNAIDFGYRAISSDPNETALFFADFVNYTILLDLLGSLGTLAEPIDNDIRDLHVNLSPDRERDFVACVAAADVFQGILEGCVTLETVENCIRRRLNAYRRFLHMNDEQLEDGIRESKTDIGEPISVVAALLKTSGVIGSNVSVFIHVDQYEELANISPLETNSPDYRRVINRALARRDPAVSYRIGTRGHAWSNHGRILGTEAKLEEERDYKFVDLDSILRRDEDPRTWVFPDFVEDVFARRLKHAGLARKNEEGRNLLTRLFGPGMAPPEKAKRYGGRSPRRAVKVDRDWPLDFKQRIHALADDDPLSARLLEAWVLQQLERLSGVHKADLRGNLSMAMFSTMQDSPWWKKERVDLALVQIAGRCQQRPLWSGVTEIIDLSGGNILTFLSICHIIWDTANQIGPTDGSPDDLTEIDGAIQAIGIFKASDYWLKKIKQETGRSGERFRMARQIGVVLGRELYADRRMSYPGHNGFSLADDELERFPHVKLLLEEMSDYGTLFAVPHTTKEKDRRTRRKFYLSPILCPQFKLPYKRQKEPRYVRPHHVEAWMHRAGLQLPDSYQPPEQPVEDPNRWLFDDGEDL